MRNLVMVMSLVGLTACSSVQKTGDEVTDKTVAHLSKPKVFVGGKDFDDKFKKSGLINGELVSIGFSTSDPSHNEMNMRVGSDADATNRLLMSAPTEFKKVIQRTISLASNGATVDEAGIQVSEVKALSGMKSNFEDFQCITTATPNANLGYDMIKECRSIMRVPASNLLKAYNYTLNAKYKIQEESLVKELLKQQLNEPSQATNGAVSKTGAQ